MSQTRHSTPGVVLGFHHVQLSYAPGLQAALERFYGQGLGLVRLHTPGTTPTQRLAYLAGGLRIDLVPSLTGEPAGAALVHLALRVSGIEAVQARLLALGAVALGITPVEEGLRFYAKDPAGNTLELLQPETVVLARPRHAAVTPAVAEHAAPALAPAADLQPH